MAWHLSSTTSPFPKAETAPREIIDLICMVFEWIWTWLGLKETLLSKQWARTMPSTAAISRTKNFCVKPSDKRESWKIANPLSRAQHNSLKRLKAKSRNADAMQIMLKLKQKINFNHPYFKRTRSLVWSPENNDRLLTRYRQFVGHTVWFKITNTKFPPLYGSQKIVVDKWSSAKFSIRQRSDLPIEYTHLEFLSRFLDRESLLPYCLARAVSELKIISINTDVFSF